MRKVLAVILVLAGLVFAIPAGAERLTAQPLVDAAWLKGKLGTASLKVVDIRTARQGGGKEGFAMGHVPGSVFADYDTDGWRKTIDGVPGQLPPTRDLEKLVGGLGISNDRHVVIVPAGRTASDFGAATRVYWTFKVLGHDAVSILDGGWRAWKAESSNPVESGSVKPTPVQFVAKFRGDLLATAADVEKARRTGVSLIDARPRSQHLGLSKSSAVKRAGTIPGAVNIEGTKLYNQQSGAFSGKAAIADVVRKMGVAEDKEEIAFCNTGHWASLAWFGLSEILGNKKTRLYDGSMSEWTKDPNRPVEIKSK